MWPSVTVVVTVWDWQPAAPKVTVYRPGGRNRRYEAPVVVATDVWAGPVTATAAGPDAGQLLPGAALAETVPVSSPSTRLTVAATGSLSVAANGTRIVALAADG